LTKSLELLSPAKDYQSGIAAINCGADAVYIGAPKFGARSSAGNSLADIDNLIKYAHKFRAKVYVTVNTLIYDNEIEEVKSLICSLYNIGADAVIIQDLGILKMDTPPIPLFASTQTHNTTPEKVKFLESAGFSRVILARELSLEQIREIKNSTNIDLEFFIHGALCVSYSGQCYFSFADNGRSANRGECSQSCRMLYDLVDSNNNVIIKDKYLLSLKDLNLSQYISGLIEAGIASFKIEGRLKDVNYVKNVTAFYRQRLDDIIEGSPYYSRASSGRVKLFFTPDPEKSFNRGFTNYFIDEENDSLSSFSTPKSLGKEIGTITAVREDYYDIRTKENLVNGDGLCFFNSKKELTGIQVNKVEGNKVYPNEMKEAAPGTLIYRNNDQAFENRLSAKYAERKIGASINLSEIEGILIASILDEDNVNVSYNWQIEKTPAAKPDKAVDAIRTQLSKSGNAIFDVQQIEIVLPTPYFFPLSEINSLRRTLFSLLEEEREKTRTVETRNPAADAITFPLSTLDYRGNVTNRLSEKYLNEIGTAVTEKGAELQKDFTGKVLMTCKYCIKHELNICPIKQNPQEKYQEPLFIVDKNRKYRLSFDCAKCEMSVLY